MLTAPRSTSRQVAWGALVEEAALGSLRQWQHIGG
jgi:hypothetical protein